MEPPARFRKPLKVQMKPPARHLESGQMRRELCGMAWHVSGLIAGNGAGAAAFAGGLQMQAGDSNNFSPRAI
jgi:hypothetical protein